MANEAPRPLIQPPLILKYTKQPPETPFFSAGDQHVHVHLEPYNEGAYFILGDGIIPMKPPLLMVKSVDFPNIYQHITCCWSKKSQSISP